MRYNILKSKKSMEMTHQGIVIIIIALVLLLLLFIFVSTVYAPGIVEEKICRASVEKNAQQHMRGLDISKDIKCPTRYLTITDTDDIKMKNALAEEMRKCWYQFGEGKLNLFSGTDAFCSICAVVDFKTDQPLKGFSKYLMDTKLPDKDISYADFLQGYSTKKTDEIKSKLTSDQLEALEEEQIDTTKKYAIIFTYARGQDIVEEYVKHLTMQTASGQSSAIAAGAVGSATTLATAATLVIVFGTNPAGWIAAGTIVATVAAISATEFVTTYFRETKVEWMALIVLREYTAESLESTQCKTLPVSQKKANT